MGQAEGHGHEGFDRTYEELKPDRALPRLQVRPNRVLIVPMRN